MSERYLNFDLVVDRAADRYRATVLSSPAGQATSTFDVPFSTLELENFRLKMTREQGPTRHSQGGRNARAAADRARVFGQHLFSTVFNGAVQACLRDSVDAATKQGAGLRLRLGGSGELCDLPWEYLYSPDLDRFLSLSTETPIVRYVAPAQDVRPLVLSLPLRMLVMVANPSDAETLEAEQEWASLRQSLAPLEREGLLTIDRMKGGSLAGLQRQLQAAEYHIIHFIGHGSFDEQRDDGMLLLEDHAGRSRPTTGNELATVLHDHQSLRLVVLNSCEGGRASTNVPFGGLAQALVRQRIPAVVAMQCEISDGAANAFAIAFYGALARGSTLDAAIADSRKAMFAEGYGLEWGTPVLYTLSADGRVFDLHLRRPAETREAERQPAAVASPAPVAAITRPVTLQAAARRSDSSGAAPLRRAALVSTLVLVGIFLLNLLQTYADTRWLAWPPEYGFGMASAMLSLERSAAQLLGTTLGSYLSFDHHDLSSAIVLWAYTAAYFVVFPLVGAAVAIALARRRDPSAYRVLVYAVAIDYAISVIFFLALPVPERWAFPESGAVLLSDLLPNGWGYWLIEQIRPMSALDNSFPSFHVSMTVVVMLASYVYAIRFRTVVAVLGAAVILSTYFLGVHWLADLVAGTAVATISFCLAERYYSRVPSSANAT